VQLVSPDDLGPVTIDVMMPGGLEPVDQNLNPTSRKPRTCALASFQLRAWHLWLWPPCPTQVTVG